MIRTDHGSQNTQAGKPRASGDDPLPAFTEFEAREVNPARAGMIPPTCPRSCLRSGKPRASGDDPLPAFTEFEAREVNPARAGMIPGRGTSKRRKACKPRASGDDPELAHGVSRHLA